MPVLGVQTRLATIGQGTGLMKVGDGSVTLDQPGKTAEQAGVVVELVSFSETQAVVTFTKA